MIITSFPSLSSFISVSILFSIHHTLPLSFSVTDFSLHILLFCLLFSTTTTMSLNYFEVPMKYYILLLAFIPHVHGQTQISDNFPASDIIELPVGRCESLPFENFWRLYDSFKKRVLRRTVAKIVFFYQNFK